LIFTHTHAILIESFQWDLLKVTLQRSTIFQNFALQLNAFSISEYLDN